ncbi:hypothetical protein MAR_001570, partial [Mya arenaria]
TTDTSKSKRVILVQCHVIANLVRSYFIGFYMEPYIDAATLISVIVDAQGSMLRRLKQHVRCQEGVVVNILEKEPWGI